MNGARVTANRELIANREHNLKYPYLVAEKGFCWVSHKYRLIFLPIPKNASTSIRSIKEFEFDLDNVFRYEREIAEGDYRVFAVIRNPLDRFISAYCEICKRAAHDMRKTLGYNFYWIGDTSMRFSSFLDEVERGYFDGHVHPQSYFLTDFNDKMLKIDRMLNFDCLEEDFLGFANKNSLGRITLPKVNMHAANHAASTFHPKRIYKRIKARSATSTNNWKYRLAICAQLQRDMCSFCDVVVRFLRRRKLPQKGELYDLLSENVLYEQRIRSLYENDWILYEQHLKLNYRNRRN